MQTYAFLDLDDTIFQTRGKCPAEEASSLVAAALDREGQPLSFMSSRQRQLFEWLSASTIVIPVTARSWGAFRRVTLPFRHAAILDFGGVVLLPDGQLDEQWDQQMRPALLPLGEELARIQAAWQADSDARSLGVRVRVISDFDLPLYVVAKHTDGNMAALNEVLKGDSSLMSDERFFIHFNDNNLSVVPRCLGKQRAVEYVLNRYAGSEPVLTLGLGDSFSDLPFLAMCDFAMLPRNSQSLRAVLTRDWTSDWVPAPSLINEEPPHNV
ncbi:MAG: haloacid dehalogenase [Planctomycetaceae bacterium]